MIKNFFIFFSSAFLIPVFTFAFEYHISTPIPGITRNASYDLGSFVANFFQLGLALVGITSFGFIIFNGIQYVIFSNNESKINDAREGIKQAIFGFLLLISSVVILDTINPCILQTVKFWKSRETINATCNNPSSSILPSVSSPAAPFINSKDQLISKLIETEIKNFNTSLAIVGVISNSEDQNGVDQNLLRKMTINDNGRYSVYEFENLTNDFTKKIEEEFYLNSSSIPNFIDIATSGPTIKKEIKNFLVSSNKNKYISYSSYSVENFIIKEDENNHLSFSFSKEINGKLVESDTPSSCESSDDYFFCSLKIKATVIPEKNAYYKSDIIQFYISSSSDTEIIKGAFEYLVNNAPL